MRIYLFVFFFGVATVARADEISVAVAANFSATLNQLADLFERQTGHHVVASSGSSGKLYAQIVNGAPFDVFLAADDEYTRKLVEEGRAVGTSRYVYASGRLVLWSADPHRVRDTVNVLRGADVHHIALANPKLAPYGRAAQQSLQHLQLWDTLQPKLVTGENVAQAMQYVVTGNAELGFVALAQVIALPMSQRGSYLELPRDEYAPIDQEMVVLTRARDARAARQFLEYMRSPSAQSLIAAAGYK